MVRLFAVLACLLITLTVTTAIVCPPHYCDTVRCNVESNELCAARNGIIREKAGFCGCCDACIIQLQEGESCHELLFHDLTTPRTSECAAGLFCNEATHVCTRLYLP